MSFQNKRLIILYDGTWNDPQDGTNVYRLYRSIKDHDGDICQRLFYDPGVGTSQFTRLRGGMFAYGLSRNLQQGYEWLAGHYTDGDEIYIFGFSRGAYTARSLAGMIRKCGLMHITSSKLLDAAEKLYRNKLLAPGDEQCRQFRARHSRNVKIHLLGVWDTVGALGVPGTMLSERGLYSWHDTRLSKIIERAYHAVAVDEHREAYDVVLWTGDRGMKKPGQKDVEQRWFIGAHANVGGGYGKDPLSDISLAWMQEKAMAAGLKLVPCTPPLNAHETRPRDSFAEFFKGTYRLYRRLFYPGGGRHFRRFDRDSENRPAVGVSVDPSVWKRWMFDAGYRPETLINHAACINKFF